MTNRNGRLGGCTLLTLSLLIAGCGGDAVTQTGGDAATDAGGAGDTGVDATEPTDAQVHDSSAPDSATADSAMADSSVADGSPDANPPIDASGDAGSEADAVSDARADAPVDAASACDDNDLCTTDSVGADGGCVNTPIVCTASDPCHSAGTCGSATGTCTGGSLTTPVRDDFNTGTTTNAAKWTANTTAAGAPRVAQAGGVLTITDRGYLNTTSQFNPAAGVLRVTGEWTFTTVSDGDFMQIATRSDGTPAGSAGELQNGVECLYYTGGGSLAIVSRGAAVVTNAVNGTLAAAQGDTLLFDLVDDGNQVTCTARNRNGGALSTATATSTFAPAMNLVTFHNREQEGGSDHVSALDNVQIEQGVLTAPAEAWEFDESSGGAAQDSVALIDGTYGSSVTHAAGLLGNAATFDGDSNAFANFGVPVGQFGTNDFSASIWFKQAGPTQNMALLSNRSSPSGGVFFDIRINQGLVGAEIDDDVGDYTAASNATNVSDGTWHQAVAVRQGVALSLYIDGVLQKTATAANVVNIANTNALQIGTDAATANFNGSTDETRLYARALNACEIPILASRP